jgi:hypothetical protein
MVHNAVARDRALDRPFNFLNTQAAIDHLILDDGVICYISSHIEKSDITSWKNNIFSEVWFRQEPFLRKAPPMWFDMNVNVNSYPPVNTWRKRRPAYPTIAIMPGNTGRCPLPAWNPNPAMIGIEEPSTVMEGSPTPFPVRNPGPPIIRIDPSSMSIRPPTTWNIIGGPDPAITSELKPLPIGSQLIIEKTDVRMYSAWGRLIITVWLWCGLDTHGTPRNPKNTCYD